MLHFLSDNWHAVVCGRKWLIHVCNVLSLGWRWLCKKVQYPSTWNLQINRITSNSAVKTRIIMATSLSCPINVSEDHSLQWNEGMENCQQTLRKKGQSSLFLQLIFWAFMKAKQLQGGGLWGYVIPQNRKKISLLPYYRTLKLKITEDVQKLILKIIG